MEITFTKPKHKVLAWTFIIGCPLLALSTSISATKAADSPVKLTILHTNDIHAHDEAFVEKAHSIGGFPRIGHMIRLLRAKDPQHTLVIDAGDIFQGTPLFQKYKGEVEVTMMNKIGYDIYTPGNHEFDEGPQNLAKQLSLAKFAVISANMDCSAVPELASIVKPSVVKEIDGQKIEFIGAVAPDLLSLSLSTGGVLVKSADSDWMKPIEDEVAKAKAAGINKIILVTHCGVERDKMMAQEMPDVDAIIGGHSHTRLDHEIVIPHDDGSTTTIVQTGSYGKALGKLDLNFDANGRIVASQYRLINMTEAIPEDADLKAYVDEKVKPLLGLRKEILAQAEGDFDNKFFFVPWDSAIGDMLTDAWADEGREYGVQIAFQNRGGIRSRIDEGPLTGEKVEELLPFENHITYATVSGTSIMRNLEHSLKGAFGGPFLDEHGLKVMYDPTKPVGSRLIKVLIQDPEKKWVPLDPNQKYKIVINDYTFHGGEGYDLATGATDVKVMPEKMSVAFRHYLKTHKDLEVSPPTRIIPISSGVADITKEANETYLRVKNVQPFSKLTLFEGHGVGITAVEEKPVPLETAKILETAKADENGNYKFKLPAALSEKQDTEEKVCIVAIPPGNASKKVPVVSYPLALTESTK